MLITALMHMQMSDLEIYIFMSQQEMVDVHL